MSYEVVVIRIICHYVIIINAGSIGNFFLEIWSMKNGVSDPHASKIAGLPILQTGRWGSFGERA